MNILAVEIVLGFFPHGVVVLRTFEIETQEALCAIASIASGGINEQHEVETEGCGKDGVATEEIDFHLHRIAHPTENVDVVPAFFVVTTRGIVIDAHLVIVISIEIGLLLGAKDGFEGRELRHFFCSEVCGLVEDKSVAVA